MKMDLNNNLRKIYEPYLEEVKRSLLEYPKHFSYPLLMHCFDDFYEAKRKLLIVGKETFSWQGILSAEVTLDTIIKGYKEFKLGQNYYNSPFWRFSLSLQNILNGNVLPLGFLWTNFSKLDYNKTSPPARLIKQNPKIFGFDLLVEELNIVKPDILVFLTNWNNEYGWQFERVFNGVQYETLKEGYLYLCKHHLLPKKTFLTWHPNGLQYKGKFSEVLNLISDNCK